MSDHTLLPFSFLCPCASVCTCSRSPGSARAGRVPRLACRGAALLSSHGMHALRAPFLFHAAPRGARMLALWAQAPLPGGNPPRAGTRLGRRPRLWSSPSLAHSLPALPPKFQDTFSKKFNPGRKPSYRTGIFLHSHRGLKYYGYLWADSARTQLHCEPPRGSERLYLHVQCLQYWCCVGCDARTRARIQ